MQKTGRKEKRMKKRTYWWKEITYALVLCMAWAMLLALPVQAQAAESYTNAVIYYHTCKDVKKFVEKTGTGLYYASMADPSLVTDSMRYTVIGWSVTIKGNGESITVDVAKGGAYFKTVDSRSRIILDENMNDKVFLYELYKLSYEDIYTLAAARAPEKWNVMKEAGIFSIDVNAIMSVVLPGQKIPASMIVAESLNEAVYNNKDYVWHLNKVDDLEDIQNEFPGVLFDEIYCDITQSYPNSSVYVNYYAGDTEELSKVSAGNGYKIDTDTGRIKTKAGTSARTEVKE
ncbi:MAG: hypothetical protein IJO60_05225 [Agathobacter sp.]|nr:hypothetical protein [Agathobacter sp.]